MEHLDKDVISKSGKSRIFTTLMNIREQHVQLYDILKKALADKYKIGLGQYFFNIVNKINPLSKNKLNVINVIIFCSTILSRNTNPIHNTLKLHSRSSTRPLKSNFSRDS